MEFATLDFETTGLSPAYHHRVIEIGVVRTSPDGNLIEEYSTLVNPGRDLGRQDIHGIDAWEVLAAPTFSDVLGDILRILDGAVLVAHNAAFERQFLTAELERCGIHTHLELDCTIALIHRQPVPLPRRLAEACRALSVPTETSHEALSDARMASRLFHRLSGHPVLQWTSEPFCAPRYEPPRRRPLPRGAGRPVTATQATSFAELMRRLPHGAPVVARTTAGSQYLDILDSVLEDRRLDPSEADQLWQVAQECNLGLEDVRALHTEFVTQLASAALSDGTVSQQEADDLDAVATILGVSNWDEIIIDLRTSQSHPRTEPPAVHGSQLVPGSAICFTGEMEWGRRDDFEALAIANGFVVKPGISRQVDILVIADPDSQSGKARKARELGIRILSEARFLHLIGNPTRPR